VSSGIEERAAPELAGPKQWRWYVDPRIMRLSNSPGVPEFPDLTTDRRVSAGGDLAVLVASCLVTWSGCGRIAFDQRGQSPDDGAMTVPPCLALTENLVAHWTFDEGSGDTAFDSSGNGNHGMLIGPTWTTGVVGGALEFDGVDNEVRVPDSPSLAPGATSFALSAWINAPASSSSKIIFGKKTNVGGMTSVGYVFLRTDRNGLNTRLRDGVTAVNSRGVSANDVIVDDVWHHVALIVDRETHSAYSYVDGIRQDVTADIRDLETSLSSSSSFRIGSVADPPVGWRWQGRLDEVRVYNRALCPDEVRALHESAP
jgi:hypothetical protein